MATDRVPSPHDWAIIREEIERAHQDVEAIRAAFDAVDALLDRCDARLIRLDVLIKSPDARQ